MNENKKSNEGTWSIICVVIALVSLIIPIPILGLVRFILIILGIILGAIGWGKGDRMGLYGLILGVVTIIIAMIATIYVYMSWM